MSERARRLSHLRELESRQAELDALASDDLRRVRELLDPLLQTEITRVDIDKAMGILRECKQHQAELRNLGKQIRTLKDELGE